MPFRKLGASTKFGVEYHRLRSNLRLSRPAAEFGSKQLSLISDSTAGVEGRYRYQAMKTHIEKNSGGKRQTAAAPARKQALGDARIDFLDDRKAALTQRKMQAMAAASARNDSASALQFRLRGHGHAEPTVPVEHRLSAETTTQMAGKEALTYGAAGLVGGGAIGAAIGAGVGSIVPGIGTAIGAGVGAGIGATLGVIGGAIAGALRPARTESALVSAANGGSGEASWSCHNTVHNWLVEAGYGSRKRFPAKHPQDYQNQFYAGTQNAVRAGGNFTDSPGKLIVMYDVGTNQIMHSMVSLGNGRWKGHNNVGTFGSAAPFTGIVDAAALPAGWWQGNGNVLRSQFGDLGDGSTNSVRIVWMNPGDIGAAYR